MSASFKSTAASPSRLSGRGLLLAGGILFVLGFGGPSLLLSTSLTGGAPFANTWTYGRS